MSNFVRDERGDNYKKAIVFTIVFLLLVTGLFYGINRFRNKEKDDASSHFSACKLSYKESSKLLLGEDIEEVFEIKDYLYYGETLSLFEDVYDIQNKDAVIGRNIVLTNLCSKDEVMAQSYYLVTGEVDNRIPLDALEDGFYSISIAYNMLNRRAYSSTVVNSEFVTIRRNGEVKKVTLIADKSILDTEKKKDLLDRNYFYLKVETVEPNEEIYDIVIDPGYHYDNGDYVEYGQTINGLNKTEETYKAALIIQKRLEEYGLKVLITRDDGSSKRLTYGIGGRLDRAYSSKAKYYVDLQMSSAQSSELKGTQIDYSSFASSKMAVSILNYFLSHTDLESTGNKGSGNIKGVVPSARIDGYDGRMTIRESGGRILGAGVFSEKAKLNASFAKDNRYGMQAITIEYIYLTNKKEAKYWSENYKDIALATADALLNYLEIEK